jgi:hypothetical protein
LRIEQFLETFFSSEINFLQKYGKKKSFKIF